MRPGSRSGNRHRTPRRLHLRDCRQSAEADPAEILFALLALAGKLGLDEPPDIAGYQIEKKLGAGGFGAVYLARPTKGGDGWPSR